MYSTCNKRRHCNSGLHLKSRKATILKERYVRVLSAAASAARLCTAFHTVDCGLLADCKYMGAKVFLSVLDITLVVATISPSVVLFFESWSMVDVFRQLWRSLTVIV